MIHEEKMRALLVAVVTLGGWTATATATAAPPLPAFSQVPNPGSRLIGLHLNRPSTEVRPHGISLDLSGIPIWDTCALDSKGSDLVLAYSHTLKATNLRLRDDTAQLELGQRVGRPVTPFQFHVTGGDPGAPLGGIGVATFEDQPNLHLYNLEPGLRRTNVNFFNLFAWGTDSTGTGTPDLWLYNYQTGTYPFTVSPDNQIGINGSISHTGLKAGFFGAPPIPQPIVRGSRSDGTPLANLLSQLTALGLITDATGA
jgi:hypothetical protein